MGRAVEHLELGRRLAPWNPSAYLQLATAYRKRGQPDEVRAMLAMVAKLNEEQAQKRRSGFNKEHGPALEQVARFGAKTRGVAVSGG